MNMPRVQNLLTLAALLISVPVIVQGDETFQPPEAETTAGGLEGLLVLRNGNVLPGIIVRVDQHYLLNTSSSEMHIPVEQVEMVCRTIDEVYQRRRNRRTGSLADSHIELARWCLRHDLLEYAARELLDARALDSEHRQLELMERQLQLALKNRDAPQRKQARQAQPLPTEAELKEVEKLPLWAKRLFVSQIQPLVIDSCATSGCHQVGSAEQLQLNRLALDGPGHPGTTLRNLSSLVEQLDLKNPTESPLLVHARRAHGADGTEPPSALERRKYQMLLTWVEQLAIADRNAPVDEVQLVEYEQADAVDALPLIRQAMHEESADPFDPTQFNNRQGRRH